MQKPKTTAEPGSAQPVTFNSVDPIDMVDMVDMDSIDVFLFDLGNVLIYFSHEQMFAQVGALTGSHPSTVKSWFSEQGLLVLLETGKLTPREFAAEIRSRSVFEFTDDQLSAAMSDIFTTNEEMVALLPEIKARGKKLVLVSNTSAVHYDWEIRKNGWLTLFDEKVLSHEVGAMKPDPAYYRAAIKAAGILPERCLFIDDIQANIEGARLAGFQTLHFTGTELFRRAMSFEIERA